MSKDYRPLEKINTTQKPANVNGIEVRCGNTNCNRKLGELSRGKGTIKCPKCGTMNEVNIGEVRIDSVGGYIGSAK